MQAEPRRSLSLVCCRLSILAVLALFVGLFTLSANLVAQPQTADPAAPPDVVPPPAGVPKLLVGVRSQMHTRLGRLLTGGVRDAYLSDLEERRLAALSTAMIAQAWAGPLTAVPLLSVPVRRMWDPIKDNTGMPELPEDLDPSDPNKLQEIERQFNEIAAYCDAITKAYTYKAPQFAASAKPELKWQTLKDKPRHNRGEVVHAEGTLARLVRRDVPLMARSDNFQELYEGWVFDKDSHEIWCVVFAELPEGLKPAKRLSQPVTFDGYFFKMLGYQNESKQAVAAPLLIGNSPVLKGPLEPAETIPGISEWGGMLMYGIFGIVVLVVVLAVALTVWFRRGDAQVRGRLTQLAHKQFVDPSTVDEEGPDASVFGP